VLCNELADVRAIEARLRHEVAEAAHQSAGMRDHAHEHAVTLELADARAQVSQLEVDIQACREQHRDAEHSSSTLLAGWCSECEQGRTSVLAAAASLEVERQRGKSLQDQSDVLCNELADVRAVEGRLRHEVAEAARLVTQEQAAHESAGTQFRTLEALLSGELVSEREEALQLEACRVQLAGAEQSASIELARWRSECDVSHLQLDTATADLETERQEARRLQDQVLIEVGAHAQEHRVAEDALRQCETCREELSGAQGLESAAHQLCEQLRRDLADAADAKREEQDWAAQLAAQARMWRTETKWATITLCSEYQQVRKMLSMASTTVVRRQENLGRLHNEVETARRAEFQARAAVKEEAYREYEEMLSQEMQVCAAAGHAKAAGDSEALHKAEMATEDERDRSQRVELAYICERKLRQSTWSSMRPHSVERHKYSSSAWRRLRQEGKWKERKSGGHTQVTHP